MFFRKNKQRTFNSEDRRKNKLFDHWNQFLAENEDKLGEPSLGGVRELAVEILQIAGTELKLVGENEADVYSIQVSEAIARYSAVYDIMTLALVPDGERWRPIEIEQIGSMVTGHSKKNGFHCSYNPMLEFVECPHCRGELVACES